MTPIKGLSFVALMAVMAAVPAVAAGSHGSSGTGAAGHSSSGAAGATGSAMGAAGTGVAPSTVNTRGMGAAAPGSSAIAPGHGLPTAAMPGVRAMPPTPTVNSGASPTAGATGSTLAPGTTPIPGTTLSNDVPATGVPPMATDSYLPGAPGTDAGLAGSGISGGGLVPIPGQSFGTVGVSTIPLPGNSFGTTAPSTGSDQPSLGAAPAQGLDRSGGNTPAQSANIPGVGQTPGQGYQPGTSGVNSPITTGSITSPASTYTNSSGGSRAHGMPTKAQCSRPYVSTYVWSEAEFLQLCQTTGGR